MQQPAETYGRPRRLFLPILLGLLVAALVGAGGMAWLFYRYDEVSDFVKPRLPVIVPPAAPQVPPRLTNIAPPPPAAVVETIIDQRIGQIEEKVEDIDERTAAASSEAMRAERLLVAFAARRAIDRGAPLGYLEGILREKFAGSDPRAVATVISASREPVTADGLREQLEALRPQLEAGAEDESWLDAVRREIGGLIVIRKAGVPSTAPVDRFARAQEALASGNVDKALTEIARLPARAAAAGWISEARRYVQARAALDRIESAALLEPTVPAARPAAAPVSATAPLATATTAASSR